MASKTYYYACVSSASSNLARQVEAFHQDGADDHDIITETKSDKDTECSKYNAMKQHMLRSGDTLVVMSLDALGHNKRIIKDELDYYRKNNIRVRVLNIPTSNFQPKDGQEWIVEMMNRLIIEMLTSQLEQERLIKRQHQAEGIAIAKAKGKYKGRQPKQIDETLFRSLYSDFISRKITKTEMAVMLDLTRPTLDKLLKKRGLLMRDENGKAIYVPITK